MNLTSQIITQIFSENGFTAGMAICGFIILVGIIYQNMKQQNKNTLRAEKREDDYVLIIKSLKDGLQKLFEEMRGFRAENITGHQFIREDISQLKGIVKEEHGRIEDSIKETYMEN